MKLEIQNQWIWHILSKTQTFDVGARLTFYFIDFISAVWFFSLNVHCDKEWTLYLFSTPFMIPSCWMFVSVFCRSRNTDPVCSGLQTQILSCYRENRDQTLRCSGLAKEYMQCINAAKKVRTFFQTWNGWVLKDQKG